MDNSFVAMEQNQCPICGVIHTHNTGILLNKRLKSIPKEKTITGYSLCEEHSNMEEEYICLVGCSNTDVTTIKMEDADRTGELLHIRRSVFPNIFNESCPNIPFVFCEDEVIQIIKEKM